MADQDPNQNRPGRILDIGDTDAADIVDRTGEQMPRQSHDGLEDQRDADGRSVRVNDEDQEARQRLWRWLLLAALVLLVAETAVSNWISRNTGKRGLHA